MTLEKVGIPIEVQHHEVGTAGQAEIDMRFDTLSSMADKLMLYKYVVKNVARAAGKTVTFMPKPLFQDNGSGMHVHQSLWKGGEPLFFDEKGYAGLSDIARWYIGGLLTHAPSLLAFTNPTVNSYKRLVPGYEAPVNLVYSQRNRSAAVRIPLYSKSPKAKRIEFRCPDPSCNPYLAFSALLMAGLDGIQNRIEPPAPLDRDLYDLPPEELAKVPQVPGSLDEVLDRARGRPRVPARRRRVHARRHRDVGRVQARERGRRAAAAPAPVGVLPLLRHLTYSPCATRVSGSAGLASPQKVLSSFEFGVDRVTCAVLLVGEQVAVGVERGLRRGVPEPALDDLHRGARADEQARVVVPEIVRRGPRWQVRRGAGALPHRRERVLLNRCVALVREHETELRVRSANAPGARQANRSPSAGAGSFGTTRTS